jgi:hypothetical protein
MGAVELELRREVPARRVRLRHPRRRREIRAHRQLATRVSRRRAAQRNPPLETATRRRVRIRQTLTATPRPTRTVQTQTRIIRTQTRITRTRARIPRRRGRRIPVPRILAQPIPAHLRMDPRILATRTPALIPVLRTRAQILEHRGQDRQAQAAVRLRDLVCKYKLNYERSVNGGPGLGARFLFQRAASVIFSG